MARPRGDPALILAAQREGTRQPLISAGIMPERVAELLEAFDALAERQDGRGTARRPSAG
ncbi:MAG: hypothetical protein ACJ765_00550 [Chloroflexota bacterium]